MHPLLGGERAYNGDLKSVSSDNITNIYREKWHLPPGRENSDNLSCSFLQPGVAGKIWDEVRTFMKEIEY